MSWARHWRVPASSRARNSRSCCLPDRQDLPEVLPATQTFELARGCTNKKKKRRKPRTYGNWKSLASIASCLPRGSTQSQSRFKNGTCGCVTVLVELELNTNAANVDRYRHARFHLSGVPFYRGMDAFPPERVIPGPITPIGDTQTSGLPAASLQLQRPLRVESTTG